MASRRRARAAGDRPDLRAQQLHAEHVGPLPADVFLAHVDHAVQSEAGAGRGRGHAVLAGARLGDHPPLAHAARQQRLAQRVVDLVGAGMVEVFAFQVDAGPAAMRAQALGEVQGRRPADVVPIQLGQLLVELRIGDGLLVLGGQLLQRVGEGFGDVAAAEGPKTAGGIGNASAGRHADWLAESAGNILLSLANGVGQGSVAPVLGVPWPAVRIADRRPLAKRVAAVAARRLLVDIARSRRARAWPLRAQPTGSMALSTDTIH